MCSASGKIPAVVWGAGGHALQVTDAIREEGRFSIIGYLDDVNPGRQGTMFCGAPVLGGAERLLDLRVQGISHLIVAVGDCLARLRLADRAREAGWSLLTAVHPTAVVGPDVTIGAGTVVTEGAIISPAAVIGENVIVNTSASVGHESHIGDGVHLGPGVHLGGRVAIAHGTWVGIGAVITNQVRIGAKSIIGAGSVVLRDIPDGVVAYGVPARVARKNRAATD